MAYERVGISVLVVDDDDTSLITVANILSSLQCKVLIARGVVNALEILREFVGFLDIVITELHMSGMNGIEFLRRVEREFQLPVIMMSADRRKNVICQSLANGAKHYILKPLCTSDFKDICQHAIAAKKGKPGVGNIEEKSLTSDNIVETRKKRKYCQRKIVQMNGENQSGKRRLVKKPKIVWTTYLHSLFLLAINQIGLERAVPKRILEVMKVPDLTRENIASHLQKYRIFLKKVAHKGIIEGLSNRDLNSRFASGLTTSMIQDFNQRHENLNVPTEQYVRRIEHQTSYEGIINVSKPYNNISRSTNYVTSTPLETLHQLSLPNHQGLNAMLHNQHGDSLNQERLGVLSSYGTNHRAVNIQQKMSGSYANPPWYKNISNNNDGCVFPSNGIMKHGLMTSAVGLRASLKYGDNQFMSRNYGSMGNFQNKFSYGQGNLNSSNNNLPSTTSTYNPSSSIQLNGGSQMVGNGIRGGFDNTIGVMHSITNTNSNLGLINETAENVDKDVEHLEQGNFDLAQGEFAFASTSSAEDEWPSDLLETLLTDNEVGVENVEENVEKNDNATMKYDISNFCMTLDEMDLLIEPEKNFNPNEFSMSDFSSSSNIVQSVEQSNNVVSDVIVDPFESTTNLANESPTSSEKNPNKSNNVVSDVIVNPFESTTNLVNESPTSPEKNPNKLGGDEGLMDMEDLERFLLGDDVSSTNNSETETETEIEWDLDFIESMFDGDKTK